MSLRWNHVSSIFLIIMILTCVQVVFANDSNATRQDEDSQSINIGGTYAEDNNFIPPGFKFDINEALRLEAIRRQNPSVLEDLICIYEDVLARLPIKEYPVFRALVDSNLANAYKDRIYGDRAENLEKAIQHYNNSLETRTRDANPVDWAKTENDLAIAYLIRIRGDHADNLEKAIQYFNNSLEIRTRDADPANWTKIENNLGIAYTNRIRGDRAENLEKAIQYFNNSLEVRTREADPVNWAGTENNLATAYCSRIRGDHADNLEKAIQHFNNSLEIYARETDPIYWAGIENNLGNAYLDRIYGNRSENLEDAIQHLNNSLEIRTCEADPVKWVETENNLANAYLDRIRGDRAENLEKAIQYFNNSLEIYTREADPTDWAGIENNLGIAYKNRIYGAPAENLEKAIEHFDNSLDVYTREADPINWAMTENSLGNAYSDRIHGDRAENLEKAIQHYNNSLTVYTRKGDPIDWAMTENNLATAYWNRIHGDHAENLEEAIQHFNNSLDVYTREADPINWAMTENNLGNAYGDRIRGDRAENLEKAIQLYSNSLMVYTREADPIDWAMTENNLGNAYNHRIRGIRSQNLEEAIQHFNNSLEVRTREADPVNWAITENNLGIAYKDRIFGNRAQNLEKAIQLYNNSLEVRTREVDPANWAITENNLGNVYSDRIFGNRSENLEMAIEHYKNAIQVSTANSSPRNFRLTERNLGNLYFKQDRWQEALDAYKNAIAAGDLLYRSSLSADSKSAEMNENSDFYKNAAFAASRLNRTNESLLLLEKGKTRVFTESLRLRMKRPANVPNDVWSKYEQAADIYRTLQATPLPREDSVKAQHEREIDAQKSLEAMNAALIDIRRFAPRFQKDIEFSDIQNTLDESTALLSFCVTSKGSLLFVVTRSGISLLDIPGFNTTDLNRLVFETDAQGHIIGGWVGNISSSMNTTITEATIDQVLAEIGRQLVEPAIAEIPDNVKKLIILPSGSLFLLPIHAAPIGNDKRLCDRYVVSYDPSIELLIEMKEKAKERAGNDLYAVVNPTENLLFATCEGENISRLFPDSRVDEGSNCTLASLINGARGRAYLHFACHGGYNWNDPLQSALILYNQSLLTLADLQENDSLLLSARLVTLSACETGITDILVGSADEYVGLPAGFMLSGAPCLVSSLWSVDDASTSLLMERFYFNHITKAMDVPSALQEAQHWVRGLTAAEVTEYVKNCCSSAKCSQTKYFIHLNQSLATMGPKATPFAHPYYWAGFIANGA